MLGYAIAFIAGGYLIPFTICFSGIWAAEGSAPDSPTLGERFLTAFIEAVIWPMRDFRYEANE